MATTRGAKPVEQGGKVVHVTPAEMDRVMSTVSLGRGLSQDLPVARSVARQAKVSTGTVLGRMGYAPSVVEQYTDEHPGRAHDPEAEAYERNIDPVEAERRRWAAQVAAEDAGYAEWEARQARREQASIRGRVGDHNGRPDRPGNSPASRRLAYLRSLVRLGKFASVEEADAKTPRRRSKNSTAPLGRQK